MALQRVGRWLLLGAFAVLGSACGAGLITGVAASGGSNNGQPGPPSLSLPTQDFPLVPTPQASSRTVVIANAKLPPTANLQVQLRVPGALGANGQPTVLVAAEQGSPAILSGQGASTVVGFDLRTAPIVAMVGSDADVAAEVVVLVEGREIAPPLPVTLWRQPRLRLFDGEPVFLSPSGAQVIRLAATGLRSTDATGIQVSVTTADASGAPGGVTRLCLQPEFVTPDPVTDPPLSTGEELVTAEVPGNTFAGPATFLVDDAISGRSASVAGAFYRPEVAVALPSQGSTRGGTKVTLIGRALAPLLQGTTAGEADFEPLRLQFRKGDRIVDLAPADLHRDESSLDRLVFTMPPSPDGRPGDVGIALLTALRTGPAEPEVTSEVVASGVFLFANPEPVFGPRGTVLDRAPIAVSPIALEGAPNSTQATDFGVLYSEGGVGALQLLAAQENGLFIRFGPTRRVADPEIATEHDPRDLLTGDFDRDGVPDLLIVNGGAAVATHHIVLGQPAPAAPLGSVVRFQTPPGMAHGRVADFDRDGNPDVVLLPGAGANAGQRPLLLLSRLIGTIPTFVSMPVPVRPYAYDALEVGDLDGDGLLDVAVVAGRLEQKIDIAYGDGAGGFTDTAVLDYTVPLPGYLPDQNSAAVGLHGIGSTPQSLAIVSAGLPIPNPTTPPFVALVHASTARSYQQPLATDVFKPPGDPFRSSLVADVTGIGIDDGELLVGTSGGATTFSLGLLRFDPARRRFELVDAFTDLGTEVTALHLGIAFPADPSRGQPEAPAVFVQHEIVVDGNSERRLSTMLVVRNPPVGTRPLLSPDVGFDEALQGVVGGRFSSAGISSGGSTRDLALPRSGEIKLGDNNGFGALSPGIEMQHGGLVPETASVVPGPPGAADTLAFFDDGTRDGRTDGQLRIVLWQPDTTGPTTQAPTRYSPNLRPVLDARFAQAAVDPSSRLLAADVDGDQIVDLVALLRFVGRRAVDDAVLMVLRGKPEPSGGGVDTEFQFELPTASAITAVHGNSTSFALGDFAPDSNLAPVRLELALAVPAAAAGLSGESDHVRFYRLVVGATPDRDRWERSWDPRGARALIAGNSPTRVAAADFDGNGTVDLLVAADGDSSLRLFLNSGQPASDPLQVSLEAFHESLGSPLPTVPGRQTYLLLGDINGDGNVDALLASETTLANGTLSSSVASYLSSGTGEFSIPSYVSPTRLGNRDAALSVDLGDINGDGVPDLSLGWIQPEGGGRNLRVLLGGSR